VLSIVKVVRVYDRNAVFRAAKRHITGVFIKELDLETSFRRESWSLAVLEKEMKK